MSCRSVLVLASLCVLVSVVIHLPGSALAQGPAGAVIPPQGTRIPEIAPTQPPRVGPGRPAGQVPVPSGNPDLARTVNVTAVAIDGATAFPPARLAEIVGPISGTVPLQRIEEARVAILNLYRNAGYVFTVVDAVVERDGRLRLPVGEAEIVEVRLDGDIGPAGNQVLRFLENLPGSARSTSRRWNAGCCWSRTFPA